MTGAGHPALDLDRLSVWLSDEANPVLECVCCTLADGEIRGLLGRSGCGKTTLVKTAAGLIPWQRAGRVEGELRLDGDSVLELDPGQRARLLATCLDRPESQLFLRTPADELAAAQRLFGESRLLDGVIEALELGPLLDRRVTELSSGERQRVALGGALCGVPRPVLLDEPTAHLDAKGVAGLVELLDELQRIGGSALVCEQAGWRIAQGVNRWSRLLHGELREEHAPRPPPIPSPRHRPGDEVLLSARGVRVAAGGRSLLDEVDLDLRAGEVVLLTGANGAGKSSLARVLAGEGRPATGQVRRPRGGVALMLPSAELQLFATTVAGELRRDGDRPEELARVLRRHGLQHLAARAPWTLSRGERQRLVHAALDVLRPWVFIVDEPGQGLDPEALEAFVRLIHRRAEKGRAYLVISQRQELYGAAHRRLEIRDRTVVEAASGTEGAGP